MHRFTKRCATCGTDGSRYHALSRFSPAPASWLGSCAPCPVCDGNHSECAKRRRRYNRPVDSLATQNHCGRHGRRQAVANDQKSTVSAERPRTAACLARYALVEIRRQARDGRSHRTPQQIVNSCVPVPCRQMWELNTPPPKSARRSRAGSPLLIRNPSTRADSAMRRPQIPASAGARTALLKAQIPT